MTDNITGEFRRHGRIEVICGSMFSGKTEELIRRLKRAKFAKQQVEIFKPSIDTRYSDVDVVSHDQNTIQSTPIDSSGSILLLAGENEVIGIDEAQFLDNGLVDVCNQLANRGIRVIIAGLDMDFKGKQTVRPDACALCYSRRRDEGACHLREMRFAGLCQPSTCGKRQARAARRDSRVRTTLP